jgi:hypothetical protein
MFIFKIMEYKKIISVTGLGGLYELLSSKKDGALVRSLEDNTTKFAPARIHQFSHLESIEIFTVNENVNLQDVLIAMKNAGAELPAEKDAPAVKKYFEQVYPDMDFSRVYASDLKKIIRWYNILANNTIDFTTKEIVEEGSEATEAPVAEEVAEKEDTPIAEKAAEKEEAATDETPIAEEIAEKQETPEETAISEETPAKKAAKKKAEPEAEEPSAEEVPKKKRTTKKAAPEEE